MWVDGLPGRDALAAARGRSPRRRPDGPAHATVTVAVGVADRQRRGAGDDRRRPARRRRASTPAVRPMDARRGSTRSAATPTCSSSRARTAPGDPPDNGAAFWRALAAADARRSTASATPCSPSATPSYADFCGHGRRLDERLAAARRRSGCCRGSTATPTSTDGRGRLARRRRRRRCADRRRARAARSPSAPGQPFEACRHGEVPTRATPLLARLAGNRLLTGAGSAKEVRELVVDTTGSALTYEAGDSLGVWPTNCPDLVAEWLDVIGADADDVVDVAGVGDVALGRRAARPPRDRPRHARPRPLPRRPRPTTATSSCSPAPATPTPLARVAGAARPSTSPGAGGGAAPQDWVDVFTRLQPRQYSISSSPLVHPHRVRLTASIVRFRSGDRAPQGRVLDVPRRRRRPTPSCPCSCSGPSHFRPPTDPSAPAIMIGPGTGVAPFLGFLDERRARGHDGRNWLFFGEQRRATDHYYERELAALPGRRGAAPPRPRVLPRPAGARSTSRTACASTAPACGRGCRTAPTSTSAAT